MQIIKQEINETYTSIEIQGKRNPIEVSFNRKLGSIQVVNKNASHNAYRGPGRTFWSWNEALSAYKSAEMKGIIQYLAEL